MKRIVLLIIGFFPLLVGYIQNHLILTVWSSSISPGLLLLIGIAVLVIWFFVGMVSKKLVDSKMEAALFVNIAALLALLLNLFQEIILGRYWPNQIGLAGQRFYLPLVNLASRLFSPFHFTVRTSYVYILSFCLLVIVSYIGRIAGKRHAK